MFSKKPLGPSELIRLILVPALLGLVAGAAGAFMAQAYLEATPGAADVEPIRLGRTPPASNAPLPTVELADRLARVSVPLYPRKPTSGTDVAQQARSRSEAIGYAAVITSDGWLATSASVVRDPAQAVAAVGGRLLEIAARVEDPRTGIAFLKVEAAALPVVGFEETGALRPGTPLYALDAGGFFAPAAFAGTSPAARKAQAPALQDSDRFGRAFHLDRLLGAGAAGSAVLSEDGDLAGILAVPDASGAALFVPMHMIRPVLAQVFRGEAPARASFGAAYLDLAEVAAAKESFSLMHGARLTGSRAPGIPAVRPGSAAAAAGLREGDILLSVDGVELDGRRNLGELVAEMGPGSKIRFTVLRDGAERVMEVTLGGEKR